MAFTYRRVTTKTNPSSQFFSDTDPTAFNALVAWWQAQPGFVSGTWAVNPNNSNEFISEHTWNNKAAWVTAAQASVAVPENILLQQHLIASGTTFTKELSGE